MSWVAGLSDDERARMLAEVAALVEGGETPAELTVQVVGGLTARA